MNTIDRWLITNRDAPLIAGGIAAVLVFVFAKLHAPIYLTLLPGALYVACGARSMWLFLLQELNHEETP